MGVTEQSMPSYYQVINGVRYDRELLESADRLTTGAGDGRISVDDGRQLWDEAQDGSGVTATEYRTLQHIVDTYNCTDAAKRFLKGHINPDQAVEPVERVEKPDTVVPERLSTSPTIGFTPTRPYEGYLKTHDYLGRRNRSTPAPAPVPEPEPEPAAPPPSKPAATNNYVTSLAFVVCFGVQIVSTYAWFRDFPTQSFVISTVVNGVLTSFAVQGYVWAKVTKEMFVPSVAQFCGIGSCWAALVAAAMTMAPSHIVAYEFPNATMNTDAAVHLVNECGRLWFLIALLMAMGALRGSPPKALAAFLAVYLARPFSALAQQFTGFDCTANWVLLPGKAAEGTQPVDGCCVSLVSVLLLLLFFGMYSFLTADASTFVSAGSIAYGLYGVCLLASPDRYRIEAWPSVQVRDPVMEHYVVALALTMLFVCVLLHYSAKDDDQKSRSEIHEAMGFVGGLAVVVMVWYFQWLLGPMAVVANKLDYTSCVAVGVIHFAMLILGLLCIANAARPHAKSYMRRHDAQTLLLRVLYISCFALAIGFYKKTDALVCILGLNPVNTQLATWLAVGYMSIGSLYAAAAQLTEASQRVVLQFSMIMPFCVFIGGHFLDVNVVQGLFKSPMHVVGFQYLCGVLLMLLVICCHYTRPTRASKLPDAEAPDDIRTLVLRFLYMQSLYFAGQFYWAGPPAWVQDSASDFWVAHAVLDLSIGLVYMAGSSLESKAQKKLLQYGMVGTLLSLAASHQLYGLQASVLAIPALNIAAAWYACYGAK